MYYTKQLLFTGLVCSLLISCKSESSSYSKEQLYGTWDGKAYEFVFEKDDTTCSYVMKGGEKSFLKLGGKCTYCLKGKNIEIKANYVEFPNLSIERIENDTLTMKVLYHGSTEPTTEYWIHKK